ncbi:perlucin-like protein [Uranotaenia lowii]|uniref:perlucin-like protein n=1 Tax=Uranotaenia lowii TaxID=190385 RepID=UPI002479DEB9|nr:perlucin-like protein [Uranotaenia lowii]
MKLFLILTLVTPFCGAAKFYIPNFKTNWHHAHEFCHSLGMALVSIESQEKQEQLVKFIQTTDKLDESVRFWLGASDLAQSGTFTWFASSRQMTYQHWARNEPNRKDGEHCIELWNPHYDWGWNDNVCDYLDYPICESVEQPCISEF